MSEARTAPEPAPADVAAVLRDAPFVRLVARDDGDSIAAAGLLARALRTADTPFQIRVDADPVPETADDAVSVAIGATAETSLPGSTRPASTTAFAVARELNVDPDPVLALAGVVAAGSIPGADGSGDALEAAQARDRVARRPGVGIPTADLADGLAASTRLRAPASGDPEAARALLADLDLAADLDEDDHRRLASLIALEVADDPEATQRAATAVEQSLRPYATDEPFATVAGYADVLDALALEAPGTGVALAISETPDEGLRTAALETWREHGLAAHGALDAATTGRYDGSTVVRVDAAASRLPTIARLVRDFRSPEPVAIVVSEDADGRTAAAAAATDPCDLGGVLAEAAAEFGGSGHGTGTRGAARFDDDGTEFTAAVREAL